MIWGCCTHPGKSKDDEKDIEKRDARRAHGRLARLVRRAGGDDGDRRRHARAGGHEDAAPAQLLDEAQPTQRRDHHDRRLQRVQQQLGVHARDPRRLGHQREVVARGRQVELAEPRDARHQERAVAGGARVEQLAEVPEAFVRAVLSDHLEHLLELDPDDEGVRVAVAVVRDQHGFGFFDAVVGEEPSKWDEQSALLRPHLLWTSGIRLHRPWDLGNRHLSTHHRGVSGMNQTQHRMIIEGNPCTASGSRQMNDDVVSMKYKPYSSQVDTMVPRKKHA